jgi:hypothetical protein
VATLIIVRRDASGTFQHLQATWAELELVWDRRMGERRRVTAGAPVDCRIYDRRDPQYERIFLDQRQQERRQQLEVRMPERRLTERRPRAPDTWGTLGFVVVRGKEGPG